jgi:hypothetical protein
MGTSDQALPLLQRALHIMEKALGPEPPTPQSYTKLRPLLKSPPLSF